MTTRSRRPKHRAEGCSRSSAPSTPFLAWARALWYVALSVDRFL
ncbi:hypothetical protein [Actinotalea ferrariae]|nr:hypothetical protein [Actinotalea ferrariae]